jgi:tellurium resistance protein TerD
MSFNLSKGSSFNLSKSAPGLSRAGVGLGWMANEDPNGPEFDLDVSAFLLGSSGQIEDMSNLVFFNSQRTTQYGEEERPVSADNSVLGAVDELDGGDDDDGGDQEDMRVFFENVDTAVQEIVVVVTITKYPNDAKKDRRTLDLDFGQVQGCYIRVWNEETDEEILRYDLNDKFGKQDAVEFGRFIREGDDWIFKAIGSAHLGGLNYFIGQYANNF